MTPTPPLPPPPARPPPPVVGGDWAAAWKPPRFYLRGHLFIHAAALTIVAAHMAIFPGLYTPATWRGLLFIVSWTHPLVWAALFAAIAALKLAAGLAYPKLALPAMLAGAVILIWWTVGLAAAASPLAGPLTMRATAIPAVLAGLALGEHFAAITLLDGANRWKASDGG